MHDMIADPEFGAHFVVLMIVKLDGTKQFQGSVTVYQPKYQEFRGELTEESVTSTISWQSRRSTISWQFLPYYG